MARRRTTGASGLVVPRVFVAVATPVQVLVGLLFSYLSHWSLLSIRIVWFPFGLIAVRFCHEEVVDELVQLFDLFYPIDVRTL